MCVGLWGSQATYEALDRVGRECLTALEHGLAVGRRGAFTEVLDDPPHTATASTTTRGGGGLQHVPDGSQTTLRLLHYDRVHTVAAATAQVRTFSVASVWVQQMRKRPALACRKHQAGFQASLSWHLLLLLGL